MKKKVFIIMVLALLFLYCGLIKLCQINSNTEYIYNSDGRYEAIKYNDIIYEEISFVSWPYELVVNENSTGGNEYYIARNDYTDFFLPWDSFVYYSDDFDYNDAFIRVFPYDNLYVKKGFIYPTVDKNEIDEVWMSHSSTYHIITDKATVDKIVECAKSDGEIPLDKDIVEYIKEHSWDNHCLNLKYKGYPLVEKVYIEEIKEGRYIIKQYPMEDFDTIYYQDEAHQD